MLRINFQGEDRLFWNITIWKLMPDKCIGFLTITLKSTPECLVSLSSQAGMEEKGKNGKKEAN